MGREITAFCVGRNIVDFTWFAYYFTCYFWPALCSIVSWLKSVIANFIITCISVHILQLIENGRVDFFHKNTRFEFLL